MGVAGAAADGTPPLTTTGRVGLADGEDGLGAAEGTGISTCFKDSTVGDDDGGDEIWSLRGWGVCDLVLRCLAGGGLGSLSSFAILRIIDTVELRFRCCCCSTARELEGFRVETS